MSMMRSLENLAYHKMCFFEALESFPLLHNKAIYHLGPVSPSRILLTVFVLEPVWKIQACNSSSRPLPIADKSGLSPTPTGSRMKRLGLVKSDLEMVIWVHLPPSPDNCLVKGFFEVFKLNG